MTNEYKSNLNNGENKKNNELWQSNGDTDGGAEVGGGGSGGSDDDSRGEDSTATGTTSQAKESMPLQPKTMRIHNKEVS
jgi:hypothetical protein